MKLTPLSMQENFSSPLNLISKLVLIEAKKLLVLIFWKALEVLYEFMCVQMEIVRMKLILEA